MSSINVQAQDCVTCEVRPPPENTPSAVCGTGQPATSAEPIQVTAVAVVANEDCGRLDWPLEDGVSNLPDGATLYRADRPITQNNGQGVVYAAPMSAEPAVTLTGT